MIHGDWGNDYIDGGADNDTLYGDDAWDEIHGGDGHDTLYGGDGRDLLYGDWGDDTIWGGDGNDRIVGWCGNDSLHGGAGMDGLFARYGNDTIDSGPGSDRIYVDNPVSAFLEAFGEDAAFAILNSPGGEKDGHTWSACTWAQDELDYLDDILLLMHETKGNDTTIQTAGGGHVAWIRAGTYGGSANAWNSEGTITMTSSCVNSAWWFGRTIVHELGHNWDVESPYWGGFKEISGWTQANHDYQMGWSGTYKYGEYWWYQLSANFYRPYGWSHPVEDWSTCWEAYFFGDLNDSSGVPDYGHTWMQSTMPQKYAIVNAFLTP